MLVKFDEAYPHGDAQDAFEEIGKTTKHSDDVLIGEVNVKGNHSHST